MSSQLPNITGQFTGADNNTWANGVFQIVDWGQWTGDGANRNPTIDFNASRSSSIYKTGVTQVFGDAMSMNIYIKALM